MRVVALLAAYNEERFIGGCLDHLIEQGVEAHLLDNCSTDRTVEIASAYLGRGLIAIETLPRTDGLFRLQQQFERREELAASIDADWFVHMDPDEIRLAPRPNQTLAEAFTEVDAHGYNAVNFLEYTFVATRESPEHDHPDFRQTMRWYYPFVGKFPHQIKAWKRQPGPVGLVQSHGHRVDFPGLRLYPVPFKMKHYQILSLEQARIKYLQNKKRSAAERQKLYRNWRVWLVEERMQLPSESELNYYISDDELSLSKPRIRHVMEEWALPEEDRRIPERPDGSAGGADLPKGPERAGSPGRRAAPRSNVAVRGQLIVAGFHRSGTSLTAQLLHRSGVFLGYKMLPKHRSNPHGHFEDREIVSLHDEMLADNGLTWQVDGSSLPVVGKSHRKRMMNIIDKREAEQTLWGFKDPRVCLFLDAWKTLLPDARVLLVYRNFTESVHSLHQRAANGLLYRTGQQQYHRRFWEVPDLALKMWLTHNRALIDFAHAHPEDVLAVSFDMLRRGFPLVEALNQYWGLALAEIPTSEVFVPKASAEPRGRQLVLEDKLIGEVLDTWEALEQLGRRTEELTGTPVEASERPTERAFYRPTDAYASEMKNELLSFELRHTRERLEKAERSQKQLEKQLAEARNLHKKLQAQLKKARKKSISPQRRRELREADTDLKVMVKRMSESRAASLFRLKHEFRELERKYSK